MKVASPRFTFHAAAVFLLALLVGSLVACGGAGGSNKNPPPPPSATEFLYAGNAAGGVFAFSVDPNTGALAPVSGSPFPVGTAAPGVVRLAADPSGNLVYATNASTGGTNFISFNVNGSSGALTSAGAQQLQVAPGKIAVDPSGHNAYMIPDPAANSPITIAFSIDPSTHALAALPNQPNGVSAVPQDITVDPSGKFVFLTFAGMAGAQVAGRLRDGTTGQITFNPLSPFGNTGGNNAQGIRVTPNGTFAVIANAGTNNVSVMSLNAANGVLTNIGGSPFGAGTGPAAVAIDPAGKFVFVANQTSSNLSAYTINAATGGLAPIAGSPFPTGNSPQSVAVDPTGKFVYVSAADGSITAFTIDAATGALTPVNGSPFGAGAALRDVVVVRP